MNADINANAAIAASKIADGTAHSNIGSVANDTQATINTEIDTALSGKIDTAGTGLTKSNTTLSVNNFELKETKTGNNARASVYSDGLSVFLKVTNNSNSSGNLAISTTANSTKDLVTISDAYHPPAGNLYQIARSTTANNNAIIRVRNNGSISLINQSSGTSFSDINCIFYYPLNSRFPST